MTVGGIRALRGPNVWARTPVLEAEVTLDDLAGPAAGRLAELLGALVGAPVDPGRALDAGLARAVADAAVLLLGKAGSPQVVCGVRSSAAGRAARVAFTYDEEPIARAGLAAAAGLCDAAVGGRPYDVGAEVERLREVAGDYLLGPTTAAVVAAARARDIPARRLLPGRSLFQFGHGARLHRVYGSSTDRTGVVSQAASQDKDLTKEILSGLGLPVPEGRAVVDAEDAWTAANEIGIPVVVKPRDYDYGHGIGLNLTTREQVVDAYAAARERSEGVLVERFVPGDDHRVLVIDGRVVAVSRRRPPQVVGDGTSTVSALVDRLNADPRRGVEPTSHLRVVRLEETELAALADQGYRPESVPPAGARVLIRRNSHLRNGGSMTDETDRIHPTTAAQAVEAALALGIDIAGLDVVAEDITRPLDDQRGAILEVNASPGFDLHIAPWASHPRPVGEAVVASLFPAGESGRIPIVAVTGGPSAAATARLIARVSQAAGRRTGLACGDGLFVGDRRVTPRPADRYQGARDLLANPAVEAAVLAVARSSVVDEGLAFDRCDVAVISGGGTPGEAEQCLAGIVPAGGAVVMDADALESSPLASTCQAPVILTATNPSHDAVSLHRGCAGRAVFFRDGVIILAHADREETLGPRPASSRGKSADESVLAAVAAAWALGLPPDAIRSVLNDPDDGGGSAPSRGPSPG